MKTEIKFYSGIHTIGGVIMTLTYNQSRVILELGTAYDPATDVFDGTVIRRNKHWLSDLLHTESIPAIDGVFPKKYLLNGEKVQPAEDCHLKTAAFISHMHLDHMACMGMMHDSIDVYLSKPAQILEEALETVGEGIINIRTVPFKDFHHLETVIIGDIKVTPYLIKDVGYQDWSFYVETPDFKLHYTGDLVMHSDCKENVLKEMEWVKDKEVDILVCDATSFMDDTMTMIYGKADAEVIPNVDLPEGMLDYEMVDDLLLANMKTKTGLCVVNFYEREVGEILKLEHMAKECHRLMVYEPKTAYLVHTFYNRPVHVFIPDTVEFSIPLDQQPKWFQTLYSDNIIVTREEIKQNPSGYLVQNSYKHILELFDLPGEKGSYLHSGGTPIGAFDPAYKNLLKILSLTEFEYVTFFCENYFSHSYPQQAKYYVDYVNPEVLISSHSKNPERLKAPKDKQQLIPTLYATYVYENKQLVKK